MLRNAKALEGFELRARDGQIGHVRDFYFDDRHWTVRYFVVETGGWLSGREVLISPVSVQVPIWGEKILPVDLTIDQVRQSPGVEAAGPVARADELALVQYYNWPMYWGVMGYSDGTGLPMIPPTGPGPLSETREQAPPEVVAAITQEHHLRSVRHVTGFPIEASDGPIGHVEDFLVDDGDWSIRYLEIDTRNWWPGKKVVVAPQWIRAVGWDDERVFVDLTRETIQASPAYDPARPIAADYVDRLQAHYGRSGPPRT